MAKAIHDFIVGNPAEFILSLFFLGFAVILGMAAYKMHRRDKLAAQTTPASNTDDDDLALAAGTANLGGGFKVSQGLATAAAFDAAPRYHASDATKTVEGASIERT